MKEKQTKFVPPLPQVPSGVPRGIPFPSAVVACEQKFLWRTPLLCAVRESTTLVQPSNVGQCLREMEKSKCAAPLDGDRWLWVQGKAAGVSWMGICDVEVPFLLLEIGALVLSTLPSGWARVLVQLRVCLFSPSNNSHLNKIWENDLE